MYATETTHSGARKRHDTTVVGQLNIEWARLRVDPATGDVMARWAGREPALAPYVSLAELETSTHDADQDRADGILIALLRLAAAGEPLAARTVLQLMLGKAVRIAASHAGRADRASLEQLAVASLWDVIATYPVHRRPRKVAANLAMDTLHRLSAELGHDRRESPTPVDVITERLTSVDRPDTGQPDVELLDVLAWGVEQAVISRAEATLIVHVYCPAPGEPGGAAAAAALGLTWAAARQRCSRAIRRLASAVRTDAVDDAAA